MKIWCTTPLLNSDNKFQNDHRWNSYLTIKGSKLKYTFSIHFDLSITFWKSLKPVVLVLECTYMCIRIWTYSSVSVPIFQKQSNREATDATYNLLRFPCLFKHSVSQRCNMYVLWLSVKLMLAPSKASVMLFPVCNICAHILLALRRNYVQTRRNEMKNWFLSILRYIFPLRF